VRFYHRKKWMSARAKRRHQHERGGSVQRQFTAALRRLTDHRFWAKHPAPFSKSEKARARREARLFVRHTQHAVAVPDVDRDDGWFALG
jgi:hypothetical protein